MTNEEMLTNAAVSSWKITVGRLSKRIAALDDAQLQQQVAPGKNRLFYLVGHLTAVHDRMFPLLGLGETLYPQLDEVYLTNPDGALADPISAEELKNAWNDVNEKLTAAFEALTPQEWLQKHTQVSDEDFAKDPSRNRLAVFLSRTNHVSFHTGQFALVK
jgi:DinB superfamily